MNLADLIDEAKCFAIVRELRWPDGVCCPRCGSTETAKRGFHNQQVYRQRYYCQRCQRQFDDLTDTIFEGHHQPLRVWVLCLYFMGLNLSNRQIAAELDIDRDTAQAMTSQLREGIVLKKSRSS
jgi:transposase-like protein